MTQSGWWRRLGKHQRAGQPGSTVQDQTLIRKAARRIGIQIALATAFAVSVAAVLSFAVVHRRGDDGGAAAGSGLEPPGDRDALIRNTLIVAASLGIVIAGLVGFVIARRAVRPLGQALSLQRRFVADAGHELRTPLTVLHTRAQVLARRLPAGDPAREIADQLLQDSRTLSEIVDELLLSASLSARPDLAETLDATALVAEVAESMQVLAQDSGIALLDVTRPGALVVRGSRPALRRALIALADNAISHSVDGGTVRVAAERHGGSVALTVWDEGEGLTSADNEQLWTRFSRGTTDNADQASARPIGNRRYGLGLSLVREIAIAHGGTVSLTDAPGAMRGAVATLTIPSTEPGHVVSAVTVRSRDVAQATPRTL